MFIGGNNTVNFAYKKHPWDRKNVRYIIKFALSI